ncbi:MAG: hypothetical protein KUG77_03070 [Nannocystaceae bacterium]|nr:hypothetical protein [Nannocystaceae bacterium]
MIPVWVQRLPTIWIAFVPGVDPRMPPGAIVVSFVDAQAMVQAGQIPFDVANAWAHGADVELTDDAPPQVRSVAERLRLLLPGASRPHLAEIGSRFGVPKIATALAAYATTPSVAQLVDEVTEPHPDGVPRLSPEARLLRALTGL